MRVKLSWVKSVSADVVSQELTSNLNGVDSVSALDKDTESNFYVLAEGDELKVSLRAFNGIKFSLPATAHFSSPVIVAPESPTNLAFEVVSDE